MSSVRVVFLGTGDVFSPEGRHQAAYLIQSPESSLLVNCGATILASLQNRRLSAELIDTIFLSHFHGDHIAGLPFLFLHYLEIELRDRPLRIMGPLGVESKVMAIFGAMYANTAAEPLPYKLEFVEASPGQVLCFKDIRIKSFDVPHQEYPFSLGCEIEIGGRKIVYSGDTGWTEDLFNHTQNADLFICECCFFDTKFETHMDYLRIAENLERFGARRIILTHIGQELLDRQSDVHLEIAYDGLTVDL